MKYRPSPAAATLALLLALLANTLQSSAQETGAKPTATNIFIEVQMVAIPREAAIPLVQDFMDKTKIDKAYAQVQEMLAHGTAKLVGWPMLTTQSGQRAVIESIDEFRYATEYATGGVGVYISEEHAEPGAKLKQAPETITGTEFNSVPTAFQTRNTGVTLEVEATLSADEKVIQMNLVPQHVRLVRMNKVSIEREQTHEKVSVEQPEFDTMKTTTTLSLKSGERVLMGVYVTSDPPDHLELFILRAEVRK